MAQTNNGFILGNPRSGTSLFRLLLQGHANIVSPPESGFAHWWMKKYKSWSLSDSKNSDTVGMFLEDILSSKKIETWHLDQEKITTAIHQQLPENYAEIIALLYKQYTPSKNVKVIADKNNYYIHHLEDLPKIWERPFFIHLVRDGRDVACSYLDIEKLETSSKYKPKLVASIEAIAEEWNSNNQRVIQFLTTNNFPFITVKYEELVSKNTAKCLQEVCDFLNIEYDPQMLYSYLQQNNKYHEPTATLDWKKKTLEKPDSSRIGRYQQILSASQIASFNTIAKQTLLHFDYL